MSKEQALLVCFLDEFAATVQVCRESTELTLEGKGWISIGDLLSILAELPPDNL